VRKYPTRKVLKFGHVKHLKDLALVARTITVESKHSGGLLKVFHSKSNASAKGNLGANNNIAEETKCEDMLDMPTWRPSSSPMTLVIVPPPEDSKGMAEVGCNNLVFKADSRKTETVS
jgi:hypothetical protein